MSYKDDILEMENDRLEEEMANRVSLMKNLATGLRQESIQQTDWINHKRDVFTRADTLMGISWSRVKDATQNSSNNRKLICYFAIGGVFVFCLVFYLIKRLLSH
ncbi:BET1-like protein [Oopsacas minuta]|uniref:BET1-like protein n=1 Tax=Oopsacas minuta TaxID=111878 RepID=A0AAV7JJM7_9METZ|nr:BET1-like protein [Oopsacas minuta]